MLYEPVGYILEYEICAIIFLLIIMTRFLSARRFPNQKNRLYALILWVVLADIVMDVISSVFIDKVFQFPLFSVYVINGIFYCLQIILPILMIIYTLAIPEYLSRQRLRRYLPVFLPGIAMLLMIALNPMTRLFFYVDPSRGYVHGDIFILIYFTFAFYMVATFLVTYRNKSRLRREEYMTIYCFLFCNFAALLIQFVYPVLLISGVAITIAVTLMYFTLQNPDTMVDATTGAFTYEAMLTFLSDRMSERDQVQLIAVKIKNMSRINGMLGIENGSVLLRQVSDFLRKSTGDSWVFRMRGSCLVTITRELEDYRMLNRLLRERIGEVWQVGSTEILLQATVCSIAVGELQDKPISPSDAVSFLEIAFAQSESSNSRIRFVTLGIELLEKVKRRQAVEAALREALETGEGMELYFQPLWSVARSCFDSAEVLLRFQHPTMGRISPDEFVPIAESNGLITAMDELVVRKACAFLKETDHCRQYGLKRLEINLSALEFMRNSLPELLDGIMRGNGIDPSFLCFEITETAATESFELVKDCMTAIRNFGCGFALDDFGTGYANISQVIQLPFSIVKLDKSLLFGSSVVLEDMARMFTRMGRITVVEGAETALQVELIQSYQVDYIQGFYYARPMNQADFLAFMQKNREDALIPPAG